MTALELVASNLFVPRGRDGYCDHYLAELTALSSEMMALDLGE